MENDNPMIDDAIVRDLERLRSSTRRLDAFLGLYLVPPGLFLVCMGGASATVSTSWNQLLIPVGIVAAAASFVLVRRHYQRSVGTVKLPTDRQEIVRSVSAAALLIVGALLDVAGAPISMALVGLAVAIGSGWFLCGPHAAPLAVASVIAAVGTGRIFWDDGVAGGLSTSAMGAILIVGGWLMHRRLDEALAPVGPGA